VTVTCTVSVDDMWYGWSRLLYIMMNCWSWAENWDPRLGQRGQHCRAHTENSKPIIAYY